MKLTNTKVNALPTPVDKSQSMHWDSETRGFGVRVSSTGNKSWVVQGRVNGRSRRITLAPVKLLAADTARKRAIAALLDMYDGKDPQAERRKQKAQTETLREVMEDYIKHKRTKNGPLRDSSKKDIRDCVEKAFVDWADKPVTTITRDNCVQRFRKLSVTAPVSTNQAFRNLRALLNWVREKSATDECVYTILPINPVSQMFRNGGLVTWNPEKARTTRIPKKLVGLVWLLLEKYSDSDTQIATTCTSADLLAFMLLTGARVGEARELTWDRVNLDAELPTFHLEKVKNHNPVTLPISDALMTVLKRRLRAKRECSDFVFPSLTGKKGYITDPRTIFIHIKTATGQHVHSHALRRTFDDIAQLVGVDSDQRRQLLNHLANDVHGQNYANNPDPETLMPAAQQVGNWVLNEASISQA